MTPAPSSRPEPLRTESNAFALDTMNRRVPDILTDVLQANRGLGPAIERDLEHLVHALTGNAPVPMLAADPAPAPDYEDWAAAYAARQALDGPLTWLTGTWFFTETFVYRHLVEVIRWHETRRDPFLHRKHAELSHPRLADLLASALETRGTVSGAALAQRLPDLLLFDLWGNQADLSHPAGKQTNATLAPSDLVVDDRAQALDALASGEGTIHLVADNAGTELAMDLVLIDALIAGGFRVVLHVKAHPMFVSDTTLPDVWHMLDVLDGMGRASQELAGALRAAWGDGRWVLSTHPFWSGSRFWGDMPAALRKALGQARLIIVKGDMNYRRILDDAIWPDGANLATALDNFPAPVLALRVLKSDALVGVSAAQQQRLDALDPSWRTAGRYGMVQYAAPGEGAL